MRTHPPELLDRRRRNVGVRAHDVPRRPRYLSHALGVVVVAVVAAVRDPRPELLTGSVSLDVSGEVQRSDFEVLVAPSYAEGVDAGEDVVAEGE